MGRKKSRKQGQEKEQRQEQETKELKEPKGFRENLSPRTLRVLENARAMTERLGHGITTTGHLLTAILSERAGISQDVFSDVNAFPDMFEEEMARRKDIERREGDEYWFDCHVTKVFEWAREASWITGGEGVIEPEHLVIAVLSLPEGHAADILSEFSLDRDDLKREIITLMGYFLEEFPDWEKGETLKRRRKYRRKKSKG